MHMTSWLGTAQALLGLKRQWKGTLMFVAQPSEETVTGAKAMLADGLFQKFGKPDYAFALHTGSMPYGTVGYVAGAATSNSDSLDITFHGRGSHGSMPDKGIDPVLMASRFVVDVQGVVSREKDPMEFGVVTVGAFNAGSAGNIIPDQARLLGTIRSYKSEVRSKLHDGIERSAKAQAAMSGAPAPEIKLTKGSDAVVNDAALVNRTVRLFKAALGDKNVLPIPRPRPARTSRTSSTRACRPCSTSWVCPIPRKWHRPASPAASRCPSITRPSSLPSPNPRSRPAWKP